MIIYPYIALKGGRCVNLLRGRLDQPIAWDVDPVETAQRFAAEGAEWLHVVDLDAVDGTGDNAALVCEIIRHAEVPVQLAGGIRSRERARRWIDEGAARVVLATAAVLAPEMVRELAFAHPDQIVVSIDVWKGRVMIHGWREATAFGALDFVRQLEGWPLSQIIVTDIDRDLDLPEASFALVTAVARATPIPVIASGLARSLSDIAELKYLYNIAGAIVGRALYEGRFTLAEAIRAARPDPERVPEFV